VVGLYSLHEITLSADRQGRAQKVKRLLSFVSFFLAFFAPLRDSISFFPHAPRTKSAEDKEQKNAKRTESELVFTHCVMISNLKDIIRVYL